MLRELAQNWAIEDNLQRADLVVGIGIGVKRDGSAGKLSEAVARKCAVLYKQGLASKVLMVGGFSQNGINEAKAMGAVALNNGVKQVDILYEETSTSTIANARKTFELLRDIDVKSLNLVPQYLHARRVVATFIKQDNSNHQIYWASAPSEYDDIPGKWQLKSESKFLLWEHFWYPLYKLFGWS
jgi:uncharacterized SAM-binding protein YcdF (DUF218 family)